MRTGVIFGNLSRPRGRIREKESDNRGGDNLNWFESLCKLYSENEQYAGRYMKGRWGEDLILLPIYHNTVIAHITVYILSDGSFVYAKPVDREESITIIPVTEMSAVRTNNCAAHPLCDM